ncbi:MAG TPA: flagellar biosynthesis protein FlhF [Gammaproteobacteria bacterium]|nr:flagellar biosynthesis protein FlhF [Gammaproteobacteria bacterium]
MKIKRFFASDMRQAIRQVRDELGSDAVILSNRSMEDGIELVAAIEYDAALFNEMGGTRSITQESVALSKPVAEPAVRKSPKQIPAAAVAAQPESRVERVETQRPAGRGSILWAQEPALVEMNEEIKTLRELLQEQLSGLAWGDLGRRHPLRAKLLRRLMELGLSPALSLRISDTLAGDLDFDQAWRHALGVLAHQLQVTNDDILSEGGVVALVGPTGVGKTTTIAKLAARYALRHGPNRVALVTTDNYRIGAHEQLRTFGRILGVPVRIAMNHEELHNALLGLRDKPLVLIDTAGMSQRDVRLSEQFALLNGSGADRIPVKTYLVMSTTTALPGLNEVARAYQGVKLHGCILSKLDETTSLGPALSVSIEQELPVAYVNTGQRVPEDMQPARAHSLVIRSVSIMQHSGENIEDESLELAFGGLAAHAQF